MVEPDDVTPLSTFLKKKKKKKRKKEVYISICTKANQNKEA